MVVGTACFFALMWGFVLRERLAEPPAAAMRPAYDSLLKPGELQRESTMGIYLGTKRLGRTHTIAKTTEWGGISVHSTTRVELGELPRYIAPSVKAIEMEFFAEISALQGLRLIKVFCPTLGLQVVGTVEGDRLVLRGNVGKQKLESEIPFKKGSFLGQTFSPLAGLGELQHADVGQAWTMQMVNPLLGSVQKVRVNVETYRDVELAGEEICLYMLLFHVGSHVWQSWVTADGEVLVQGTPFGLTLWRDDLRAELLALLGEDGWGSLRRHKR